MKKLLAIFTAVVLLCAAIPLGAISVSAAISGSTGDCTWTLDGTHLTISGTGAMENYSSSYAPWGRSITSVTIEDGVTAIGTGAFYECTALTSVTIGNNVTKIGVTSFRNCTALTSVNIPSSVTTIGNGAFLDCAALTSVTIGEGVTSIGHDVFQHCTALTSVNIPAGVTFIGSAAFYNCNSLTSAIIPDSVTTLGGSAFESCDALTSVTIGNGLTAINSHTFAWCSTLTSVTIPAGITSIGERAFSYCRALTSISIPAGVTTIDNYAFEYCDVLTDVYYGGSEADKAAISIGKVNIDLLNAMWHYTGAHTYDHAYDADCNDCGVIREVAVLPIVFNGNSVSQDVSGLAFLFDADVIGMSAVNTTAVYDNATVDGYRLVSMGAVASNGKCETDIKANVLWSFDDTSASFAIRIINIPTENYDTEITTTPYVVLLIDGVETTVYGEPQTTTVNTNLSK